MPLIQQTTSKGRENEMGPLRRNVILSAISMAANFALPLATLPFLAKALGVDGFGKLAVAQATTIFLCQLVDFGFILVAARQVATAKTQAEVNAIYSNTQNTRLLLAIASTLVIATLALSNALPISNVLLLATTAPAIIGSALQATWFFQGKGYFGWLAIANLLSKSSLLIAIIFLVQNENHLNLSGFLFGLSYLTSGILLHIAALRTGTQWKIRIRLSESKVNLRNGAHAFISLALLSFHTQLLITLTGIFATPAAAGLLLTTDRIVRGISAAAIPFANALFPVFSGLYTSENNRAHTLRRRVLFLLISVSFLGALLLFFSADYIASVMMPGSAAELAYFLRIASPMPILVSIGVVYGGLTLIPAGHDRDYLQAILIAEIFALLVFSLSAFLSPDTSGLTAVIAAESALAVLMLMAVQKRIRDKTLFKTS